MKDSCIIPTDYQGEYNKRLTERLIQNCQLNFEQYLMEDLNLQLVGSPLFLEKDSGLNDDLNGIEKAVSFSPNNNGTTHLEVIHSLAKWKRNYLADSCFDEGEGILTRMNAIRKDEILSNIHSYNVDQWDWEKIISKEDRKLEFLKSTVRKIYNALRLAQEDARKEIYSTYAQLPNQITFIHSEELLELYPGLLPKEREHEIVKKHKSVFIIGIGDNLSNGIPHDFRAPDYDDWSTEQEGLKGLNGDILVWNNILEAPLEISSMGIRVDRAALIHQLEITGTSERLELPFHSKVINDEVPFTIGGGIGKSRIAMFLLEKAHIGEVQKSYWPAEIQNQCEQNQIVLL